MASTGVWSISNLELGGNCLESGSNDNNSSKDLVVSCQPRKWCSHVHKSGNSITWDNHVLASLKTICKYIIIY